MKQIKIIEAYKVIRTLLDEKLAISTAYQIFKLKECLQSQWDFQYGEEQKLLSELQPQITESGMEFKTTEDANKYRALINELGEMEIELELPHVCIPLNETAKLTPNNIEALMDFVEFVE